MINDYGPFVKDSSCWHRLDCPTVVTGWALISGPAGYPNPTMGNEIFCISCIYCTFCIFSIPCSFSYYAYHVSCAYFAYVKLCCIFLQILHFSQWQMNLAPDLILLLKYKQMNFWSFPSFNKTFQNEIFSLLVPKKSLFLFQKMLYKAQSRNNFSTFPQFTMCPWYIWEWRVWQLQLVFF